MAGNARTEALDFMDEIANAEGEVRFYSTYVDYVRNPQNDIVGYVVRVETSNGLSKTFAQRQSNGKPDVDEVMKSFASDIVDEARARRS